MNKKFSWKTLFLCKISSKYFKIGNTLLQEIAQMNYRCCKLVLWGFTVGQNVKKNCNYLLETTPFKIFDKKAG